MKILHTSAKIQQNDEFTKNFLTKYVRKFSMSVKCQFLVS